MIEEFRRKGLRGGAMFWSRSRLTGRRVMIAAATLLAVAVIFSLSVTLSRQPPTGAAGESAFNPSGSPRSGDGRGLLRRRVRTRYR